MYSGRTSRHRDRHDIPDAATTAMRMTREAELLKYEYVCYFCYYGQNVFHYQIHVYSSSIF